MGETQNIGFADVDQKKGAIEGEMGDKGPCKGGSHCCLGFPRSRIWSLDWYSLEYRPGVTPVR